MRKKRLIWNTFSALCNQVITLTCGFILPRQILINFGSDVNGLVSSITQFLGFISLLDMGVGAVVQAVLYKPLAQKDEEKISAIMISANKFFKRIAKILIAYTICLMVIFPLFVEGNFGYVSTALLVASISISSISQYYFGVVNQLLLNADQRSYVHLIPTSIATILNTVVSIILINCGLSIHIIKLVSSVILLLRPVILLIYVKNNYQINYNLEVKEEPIKQKWNAVAQHVATFIVDRTDIAVLTVLSNLSNVSIYQVYYLVVNGLYQVFIVMTAGFQSLLGDMYAKQEIEKMTITFNKLEWIVHNMVVYIFTCAGILMIPFVRVYTNGVSDANYIQPIFSWIIVIAYAICCFRGLYNLLVKAVGHFKETQVSAIIEAILNISLSVILVWKLGLPGVAIGTLIAMSYRMIYYVIYINQNLVPRKFFMIVKQFTIDAIIAIVIYISTMKFNMQEINYLAWFSLAIKVSIVGLIVLLIVNFIAYRSNMIDIFNIVSSTIKKLLNKYYKKSKSTTSV